ncbi:unnamed protein product [Thelazia callipaeda]|uniref:Ground-like domain-containing protein n=1 Tax=Thelazia callipaeda TaxID=103827 RepID=A0A0N5D9Z8_THECL|nr:unnamed protein product [Thelazia callipaeda]
MPCNGQPVPYYNQGLERSGWARKKHHKAVKRSTDIFKKQSSAENFKKDESCNDEELRNIIRDNLGNDPTQSKRQIQKVAEAKFNTKFNIICSKGDFSYITHTEKYCQITGLDVTCYAFKAV